MPLFRKLTDLINKKEPGWKIVQEWIDGAKNEVVVLPADESARCKALEETQVTTRSPMGAIVYETGGILVDGGWLRILGSGHKQLTRSLPAWNRQATGREIAGEAGLLFIADDVIGGFFALDGGALGKPGNVFYMAPDTLEWENLNAGYSDFVYHFLNTNFDEFYSPYRWSTWKEDISKLTGDQVMFFYPPLWATEVVEAQRTTSEQRYRAPVPVLEAFTLAVGTFE